MSVNVSPLVVLWILVAVSFLLGAVNVPAYVNWLLLGLFFWALTHLVGGPS